MTDCTAEKNLYFKLHSSERLKKGKEIILGRWMDVTSQMVPAADHVKQYQLRNAIPFFLDAVCVALSPENSLTDANEGNNIARDHGTQRLQLGDYSLYELLIEYKLLRQVIFEFLESECPLPAKERDIILDSIEQAMVEAGMQFAQLQRANDAEALKKLELSNVALEHFAAIAAHDLKSPIVTISGFVGVLEEEFGSNIKKEAAQSIAFIKAASTRMIDLIDRLLGYSTLSSTTAHFQQVDMNSVVSNAIDDLKSQIEESKAKIHVSRLPMVDGDESLLTQLLQNLIANALKFCKSNPSIEIDYKETSKDLTFSVKDNGIGFDLENKDNMFSLYKKLNSPSLFHGSGIGLATCKKVIEIHGGKIWAECQPNVGSTFYFSLHKKLK